LLAKEETRFTMNMQKMYKTLAIVVLSILVLSFLPSIASVWAGVGSDAARVGPPLAQLTPMPPAPSEEPITRPFVSFDDMIIQSGDRFEDVSALSDNSGVEIVPAAAFIHTGELGTGTEGGDWFFYFSGGYVMNDSSKSVCLAAPVYLPPGSVIESFTAYVYDSSTTDNLIIYFDRTSSWGGWDELAAVMSLGSSGSIQIKTDPSINSDNDANVVAPDFHYHVDFCFPAGSGADIRVFGARVDYTPVAAAPGAVNVYLPIVMKPSNATGLYIKNDSGGAIYYYRIYDTPGGTMLIECPGNIKNGAKVFCGTFTSGIRHVVTDGYCGPGSGNVTFPAGTCTRTVRCGRDPTTMVCN
jgi:hypothetical protein